jgi:hypothetical protein
LRNSTSKIWWRTFPPTSRCIVLIATAMRAATSGWCSFLDRKRAMSPHAVWDTHILLHDKGKGRIFDYSRWLNEQITPEQAAEWAKGTPEDWANEPHAVAIEQAYRDVAPIC